MRGLQQVRPLVIYNRRRCTTLYSKQFPFFSLTGSFQRPMLSAHHITSIVPGSKSYCISICTSAQYLGLSQNEGTLCQDICSANCWQQERSKFEIRSKMVHSSAREMPQKTSSLLACYRGPCHGIMQQLTCHLAATSKTSCITCISWSKVQLWNWCKGRS